MELGDELKLRVATKLIDNNVATWRDNLKLKSTALVTWDLLFRNSTSSIIFISSEIRRDKNSFNLSNMRDSLQNMRLS